MATRTQTKLELRAEIDQLQQELHRAHLHVVASHQASVIANMAKFYVASRSDRDLIALVNAVDQSLEPTDLAPDESIVLASSDWKFIEIVMGRQWTAKFANPALRSKALWELDALVRRSKELERVARFVTEHVEVEMPFIHLTNALAAWNTIAKRLGWRGREI